MLTDVVLKSRVSKKSQLHFQAFKVAGRTSKHCLLWHPFMYW